MAHQLILIREKDPAPPPANMLIRVVISTYCILIRDKNPAPPLPNMLIGVVTSTYLNSDAEQRQGCSEQVTLFKYYSTISI